MISWMGIHIEMSVATVQMTKRAQIYTIGSGGISAFACVLVQQSPHRSNNESTEWFSLERLNVCECLCDCFNENNVLTQTHTQHRNVKPMTYGNVNTYFDGTLWKGFFVSLMLYRVVPFLATRWHWSKRFYVRISCFIVETIRMINDIDSVAVSWWLMLIQFSWD